VDDSSNSLDRDSYFDTNNKVVLTDSKTYLIEIDTNEGEEDEIDIYRSPKRKRTIR
jgi:hypothetical protein